MRFGVIISVLICLAPAIAGAQTAQTPLTDRPGLWLSVPRSEASAPAPVLEAAPSSPLITAGPAPVVEMVAPEITAVIAPPRPVPDTRPIPRPRALEVSQAPDITLEVAAVAPSTLLPAAEPVAEVLPVSPLVAPETPIAETSAPITPAPETPVTLPADAAPEVVATAVPQTQPTPRPQTEATALMAEALARQIAAEAQAIVTTAPRAVPLVTPRSDEGLFEIGVREAPAVQVRDLPEATLSPAPDAPQPVPEQMPLRTAVAPVLTTALAPLPGGGQITPASAVLLPGQARASRAIVRLAAFNAPPLERAPILPRLSPSGPMVQDAVGGLGNVRAIVSSAVLTPSVPEHRFRVPPMARSAAPSLDFFPLSALPPSAFPEGPSSLTRLIQPPPPVARANAAVLMPRPAVVVPARLPIPGPSAMPIPDPAPVNPQEEVLLPIPDPDALVRMMEAATICWRLANLSMEAQWARLSVDVALDEMNMPSARSIRLTGFARVVSGAAEDAYRAANAALIGCAEASESAPATRAATLVFDRNGVRLQ